MDISSEDIHDRLQGVYDFLNNGQKLNIRELIFKYDFYRVLNDLNTNISDARYHVDIKNYSKQIKDLEFDINSILNYRLLLEDSTGNPISKLMTIESDKKPTVSTEETNPLVEILTFPKLLINNYTYTQVESEETPAFVQLESIATAKKKASASLQQSVQLTPKASNRNITITRLT